MINFYEQNGLSFFFTDLQDKAEAHVHIVGRGGQLIIWLKPLQPVLSHNLSVQCESEILSMVAENVEFFLKKWEELQRVISREPVMLAPPCATEAN